MRAQPVAGKLWASKRAASLGGWGVTMADHTFKLVLPIDSNEASISMDGKPLNNVTMIDVHVAAHSLTQIKLTMWAYVEVEGELEASEIVHIDRGRLSNEEQG